MNTEQFDGHSPGPWSVTTTDDDTKFTVYTMKVKSGLSGWPVALSETDTHLIAAAPDLLAEVKRWQPITQGCDLARLKQQKQMLLAMIWEDHDHELWGLVNLLDALQDLLEGEEVIA